MAKFEILNLLYYCLFSTFVYYQQLHLKEFRGRRKDFELILSIFSLSGMIVGFGYLFYYGYKVSWWAAFVVFIAGLVFKILVFFIENLLGKFTMRLSLLGFIIWPILAYLMFITIPA